MGLFAYYRKVVLMEQRLHGNTFGHKEAGLSTDSWWKKEEPRQGNQHQTNNKSQSPLNAPKGTHIAPRLSLVLWSPS